MHSCIHIAIRLTTMYVLQTVGNTDWLRDSYVQSKTTGNFRFLCIERGTRFSHNPRMFTREILLFFLLSLSLSQYLEQTKGFGEVEGVSVTISVTRFHGDISRYPGMVLRCFVYEASLSPSPLPTYTTHTSHTHTEHMLALKTHIFH